MTIVDGMANDNFGVRVRHTGIVQRVVRQYPRLGEPASKYPTLLHCMIEGFGGLVSVQAPHDCPDVTGKLVTITVDVDG